MSPLWPLHPKPLPDELLSSWLVRLAQAHGIKVQTLARLLFGSRHQLWNRDIDRLAAPWLLDTLSSNTATPPDAVRQTTLRAYQGRLYGAFRESSVLPWILPLKMYHRTRKGFGLQFCPRCLAADATPYFRKRWRVAFYTYCSIHDVLLQDRCPQCHTPVIFQRRELGRPDVIDAGPLTQCFACDFDLRDATTVSPSFYEASAHQAFDIAAKRLEARGPASKPRSLRYYNTLHHLCWLLQSHYRHTRLLEFARRQVAAPTIQIDTTERQIEARAVAERHHIVQLAFWLLADLEPRLSAAHRDGSVTYSALMRDFADPPSGYVRLAKRLRAI